MSFLNIMLCYQFPLEALLQDMAKNNPNKKQIEAKETAPAWILTEEKMQSILLQITRIDLHHKLQLLIRMFSFGLSSVTKVFFADFEHVLFCWKRYSTKTIVLILKYLAQQTNTYSKSSVETLKANSKDCASLLKTCSISKTLFKCFLVNYEHVFVYCDVFAVTIYFSMYLLSIFNRFHTLIYWSTVISFALSWEEATRRVL